MKFNIEIDCTPEEARQFFGLPNVEKFNDMMMAQVQEQFASQMKAMDAETLMKTWMPTGMEAMENLQAQFFNQFSNKADKDD